MGCSSLNKVAAVWVWICEFLEYREEMLAAVAVVSWGLDLVNGGDCCVLFIMDFVKFSGL